MDWRHSRPFRIVLLLSASLLLLAAIAPRFVALELVRNALTAGVMQSTGRTLTIKGGAHVLLLPRPALVLNQVSFSEPRSPQVFAEASQLRANLAFWPLLRGEVAIRGLEVDAPRLTIIHREDGSYNFQDLLEHRGKNAIGFALDELHFQDATLLFADQFLGKSVRVTALDLALANLTDSKNGQLSAKGTLLAGDEGKAAAWQGALNLQAAMRYHEAEKQLRIADLKLDIDQQGPSDKTLNVANAKLQASGKLVYGWNPLKLSGGELKLSGAMLRANQKWTLGLDLPAIRVEQTALNLGQFKLRADMQSPRGTFAAEVAVPNFTGATERLLRADAARISINLKSPEQNLALNFASPLELEHLTTARLTNYQLTGSYGNRGLTRGAIPFDLQGSGKLDLRTENLLLDSRGKLDNAPLNARVEVQDFVAPRYALNLDLARLDLSPYLPAVAAGAKELDQDQAFDFWWLERLNAEGKVRVGELVLQKMHINDLAFELKAADRKLTLDPLEATLYEGKLTGRAEIDTNLNDGRRAPAFRIKQRLSNMNINPLLSDLLRTERFEGRGHLDLDIAAVGSKVMDLRRTAGGNVKVILNKGAIRGIDIEALVRATAGQVQKLGGQEKQAISLTSRTRFSELNATLAMRHGIITSNDLNVATSVLKLAGNGFVDLGENKIDYTLKAAANPRVPELKGIVGLTLPIQIFGALNAPEYKVDYASLKEQFIARKQAEEAARSAAKPAGKPAKPRKK